jgi:nucleoid DNA-binding protein
MKISNDIEILNEIADATQLSRDQVASILDELAASFRKRVNRDEVFTFSIPGLMKVKTTMKPAIPERLGPSINSKERIMYPARPATLIAKISGNGIMEKRKNTRKPTKEKRTEIQILEEIAENAEISTDCVPAVFDQLAESIRKRVKNGQIFTFTIPGLMTVKMVKIAATKERRGINPFTREEVTIRACPARIVPRIIPNGLKRKPKQTLREMAGIKPKSKSSNAKNPRMN